MDHHFVRIHFFGGELDEKTCPSPRKQHPKGPSSLMDHPLIGDLSKASATVFHIGIATSKDSKLSKDSKDQVSRLDDNYKWLLYVFFCFGILR